MARPFRNLATLIAGLLIFSQSAGATSVKAFIANQKGIVKLKAKMNYPAYQDFLHALEADPLNPVLQMNLGLVFEANEEFEKAEATYRGVLQLLPADTQSDLRFQALFNLGAVLAKEEKIEQALQAYQEALSLEPQSKEVKTNIELLWQGGGGGKGKGEKNKDQKDKGKGQGNDGQDQKPDDKKDGKNKGEGDPKDQDKNKKPQPKPFDSQDLSKEDVKKILDEIKNQEQSIRAQEYERNVKDAPRGKDW